MIGNIGLVIRKFNFVVIDYMFLIYIKRGRFMSLSAYLIDLAENPDKLNALKDDPSATLAASGLSEEEQAVIKSGYPAQLRASLGNVVAGDNVVVVVVIAVIA